MLEIPTIFDSAKFISESCIHINQMLIPGYCSKVGQSNWIATFNSLLCSSYEWGCTDENVLGISKAPSMLQSSSRMLLTPFFGSMIDGILSSTNESCKSEIVLRLIMKPYRGICR